MNNVYSHVRRALTAGLALGFAAVPVLADPPADPQIPGVFCFRITDIERVDLADGSPNNDYVFGFEVLNWTNRPAEGVFISSNRGTRVNPRVGDALPTIAGIGVDRDGRGGLTPDTGDVDASGYGITSGSGTFDDPAIHSGRGRGDIAGALNDWDGTSFDARNAWWEGGTPVPFADLLGALPRGFPEPADLIPSQTPPFTNGDLDTLGDPAIDGGPGTIANAGPNSLGAPNGNVLDGFTMTVSDFDPGEVLSLNWFLLGADPLGPGLVPIGTAGGGNNYGFGTVSLTLIDGSAPDPVLSGNTGFLNNPLVFASDPNGAPVNNIPAPPVTEPAGGGGLIGPPHFALEFGAGLTAPFSNPSDNFFDAPTNAVTTPTPLGVLGGLMGAAIVVTRRRRGS